MPKILNLTAEERILRRRAARLRWKVANPELHLAAQRKWSQNNKATIRAAAARRRLLFPGKEAARQRRWRAENPDKALAISRRFDATHKKRLRAAQLLRIAKNRPKYNADTVARRKRKIASYRKTSAEYQRKRRARDIKFRIRQGFSARISKLLRNTKRRDRTIELLGCSMDNFTVYLESKFEPGMSWDNYASAWEIDHEIPCAIFDLSKPEHRKRCFHFSNLQPLFRFDNRSKGAKLLSGQFSLL